MVGLDSAPSVRDERLHPATAEQVEWARAYPAYQRLAGDEARLQTLIRHGRNSYAQHGSVPEWCGVDYLRGWAFYLVRREEKNVDPTCAAELTDVLDALRRHRGSTPVDLPPEAKNEPQSAPGLPEVFSRKSKMHRDAAFLESKQARLREPHVAPINDFVDQIRVDRGEFVPYVDPDSGGVSAKVLFVLESPAKPAAHGSGMLSADNDDDTAANMWAAYQQSGMPRTHGLHWNAVPWFIGDGITEKNVTRAQVAAGHGYLLELLDLAPMIGVIVAMGRPAQGSVERISKGIHSRGIVVLDCLHPSPRNNSRGAREKVPEAFRKAYEIVGRT